MKRPGLDKQPDTLHTCNYEIAGNWFVHYHYIILASFSKEIEFSMKPKKFSPALIILVGLLVIAVVAIGIVVNPPPAMFVAPQNSAAGAHDSKDPEHSDELPKEEMKKKMMEERGKMQKMQEMQHVKGKPDPVNPDAIEVNNSFFRENMPGAAGQAQMETRVAKQRVEYKASMEARKKDIEALKPKEAK